MNEFDAFWENIPLSLRSRSPRYKLAKAAFDAGRALVIQGSGEKIRTEEDIEAECEARTRNMHENGRWS
jgi:hypothetical protein